jgi:hypothetical protein
MEDAPGGVIRKSETSSPAPETANPSSLSTDDLATVTGHVLDVQRLVRICCAAGEHEIEEFHQEVTQTLGNEVLNHLWEALEILQKQTPEAP